MNAFQIFVKNVQKRAKAEGLPVPSLEQLKILWEKCIPETMKKSYEREVS